MKMEQSKMGSEVVAGVDVGSGSSNCVLMKNREMAASIIIPTDADSGRAGRLAIGKVLGSASINTSQISRIAGKEYGRVFSEMKYPMQQSLD